MLLLLYIDPTRERKDTKNRLVIRFLVEKYPESLCIANNFEAFPVETVQLEMNQKPKKTSTRITSVYGVNKFYTILMSPFYQLFYK